MKNEFFLLIRIPPILCQWRHNNLLHQITAATGEFNRWVPCTMTNITIRNMKVTDYERVIQVWKSCDGVHMHKDHSETVEGIQTFLHRNPAMSFVALDEKEVVGTILGSHDGRRGFINHLAVKAQYRKQGLARKLVGNTIDALKSAGMRKIVIFILKNNLAAQSFWERIGFANEDIIDVHSIII